MIAKEAKLEQVPQNAPRSTSFRNKTKGKWTRSNEKIGSLDIQKAGQIAETITDGVVNNLILPTWPEMCREWSKYYWMSPDDVVYRRVICLLCCNNVMLPCYASHFKTCHEAESCHVMNVNNRMAEIRLSRFYVHSVVYVEELEEEFPTMDHSQLTYLTNFFRDIGFVVAKKPSPPADNSKRKAIPSYPVNFDNKVPETMIKLITYEDAERIAHVLADDVDTLPELLYAKDITRGPERTYCYTCRVSMPKAQMRPHLMKNQYHKLKVEGLQALCSDDDLGCILERIMEVRLWKYYSSALIPMWKLSELCYMDEENMSKLSSFLVHRGFVVNRMDTQKNGDFPTYYINERLASFSDNIHSPSPSSSIWGDSGSEDDRSISSCSSSASSSCSSNMSIDKSDRLLYPFSVVEHIRHDYKILHEVLDIETMLEVDEDMKPSQFQYNFIMGWAMYSLVVSNGSKLNILSRLMDEDYNNMRPINDSEIVGILSYQTTKSATSTSMTKWSVVDKQCAGALKVFDFIKKRKHFSEKKRENEYPFFLTFNGSSVQPNDVAYFISMFLKMSSIPWTFKAGHLDTAVKDIIVRDPKKNSPDYAIEFYKQLKERAKQQANILGDPSEHEVIRDISVTMAAKTRKDKGTIKGRSMNPDKSARKQMQINPNNDRLSARVRREIQLMNRAKDIHYSLHSDDDSDSPTSDVSDNESMDLDRQETPEPGSPSRAFAVTPPPAGYDSPTSYSLTEL